LLATVAAVGVAAGVILVVTLLRDGGGTTSSGLPNTPDYHSLMVSPSNADALVLGTHNGLYESRDGGRTWTKTSLAGQDAMNLARADNRVVWVAGHNVLARSSDDGRTWQDVRPDGLPSLDVHGFAVDPRQPRTLYAAVAGEGLYRSVDAGDSFSLVSRAVGPGTFGLALTPGRRLLAAEPQRGLFASSDGGQTWKQVLAASTLGVAVSLTDPMRVLATGRGIFLSRDGGDSWRTVRELADGAGPVAWSRSEPRRVYVVGFDRTLYRSDDAGASWRPVGAEE
jgi:photosystem II stability/assembly factor-like uncharacterized protein